MEFYSKATVELAEIESRLAELIPLQRRRDQLRAFIDAGKALYESSGNAALTARPRQDTAKARILDGSERIIRQHGPKGSRELVELLEQEGVHIGGTEKLITVSTLLSRAKDRFQSDRAAGGWVLVNSHNEQTPQGADTPAGL
jgi:hypothetical protein